MTLVNRQILICDACRQSESVPDSRVTKLRFRTIVVEPFKPEDDGRVSVYHLCYACANAAGFTRKVASDDVPEEAKS